MKYIPKLSMSVWATLALLVGGAVACLSPAWSADQKPLVINPTTGKQEQLQADNTLSLPANLFSMLRTTTDPSGTSNPFLVAQTVALTGNNANRPYAAFTWTTTDTAFNYTGFYNRALQVTASHIGTGTVSSMTSLNADSVMNRAGGTTTRMTSMRAAGPTVLAGTVTTGNALYLDDAAATGTLTTYNALEIAPIAAGTTRRAIYTQGAGLVVISDTTASTSSTTGAVQIGNGVAATSVGIGGGRINAGSTANSTTDSSNAIYTPGGIGAGGNVVVGSLLKVVTSNAMRCGAVGSTYFLDLGTVNLRDGDGSTGSTTSGNLVLNSTLEATAVNAASLTTTGGLGVTKRSYLGIIGSTFKGNVLAGVQDGTAAVSGQVGEVITGNQSTYTNMAGSGTYGQITTVSLTPGAWEIRGMFTVSTNSATITANTNTIATISTTTASAAGTTEGSGDIVYVSSPTGSATRHTLALNKVVNISATTSYYLNAQSTYSAGNPQAVGSLTAVRIR